MTLNTSQMRIEWSEYLCSSKDWFTIELLSRAPVKTIMVFAEARSAFERVMYFHGYGDAMNVGSYACRDVPSSSKPSMHACRFAVDVDAPLNWLQGRGATMDWTRLKITKAQIDAGDRVRTHSGAQVFRNGWVFKNPDPMHFQLECSRTDIASGIDWRTVPAETTRLRH
jgi:hypothetical protein